MSCNVVNLVSTVTGALQDIGGPGELGCKNITTFCSWESQFYKLCGLKFHAIYLIYSIPMLS